MRLKRGISAHQADEQLGAVLQELSLQRSGGRSEPVRTYVRWVGDAERRLFAAFAEPDVAGGLHTARYPAILDLIGAPPGGAAISVLYQEIEYQHARLAELADKLSKVMLLANHPGDELLVYDTNGLMHYQPPNRIKWSAVVDRTADVRVVVPLCVIYELDHKTYTGSEKMAAKARAAVKALRQITDGAAPGRPVVLRHPDTAVTLGATFEVWVDETGHQRLPQTDDEIIDRAVFLEGITGKRVRVITRDMNMSLRADAAGMGTIELPDEYLKVQA